METKVTLLIIYLLLGILGSILFLIDIYKTYKELSLSDVIVFFSSCPHRPNYSIMFINKIS